MKGWRREAIMASGVVTREYQIHDVHFERKIRGGFREILSMRWMFVQCFCGGWALENLDGVFCCLLDL